MRKGGEYALLMALLEFCLALIDVGLAAVAIIAILASVAMPLSEVAAKREKEQELRRALRDIRDALDAYKNASDEGRILRSADQSGFPPDLKTLVDGVTLPRFDVR